MLFMDVAGVITDDLELVNEEVNDFEKSVVCGSYFALYFYATKCGFSIKMKKRVKRNEKEFSRVLLKINLMKFLF